MRLFTENLFQALHLDTWSSIAIFGLSKNAGKTVCVNTLLQMLVNNGNQIGITSTGRDGEHVDALLGTAKPPISIAKNVIYCTARNAISLASSTILKETSITTPFGPITMAQAHEPTQVILLGPRTQKQLEHLIAEMQLLGTKPVLIDGSIDRKSFTASQTSEATVMVVGATVSQDLDTIIETAQYHYQLFSLPVYSNSSILPPSDARISIGVEYATKREQLPYASLLGNEKHFISSCKQIHSETARLLIYLPKSLPAGVLKQMPQNCTIIVPNSTHLFCDMREFNKFITRGGEIYVEKPITLIGIASNPFSPEGWSFDPHFFAQQIKLATRNIPIFDVVSNILL